MAEPEVVAGKYELKEQLGKGGFGTVYRALHRDLGRDVALKVMNPGLANDDAAQRRFLREVEATTAFVHKFAVQLRDFGRDPALGVLYYTMDLVDGPTLRRALVDAGRLPAPRAVQLVAQVCEALEEAHAAGLVHRDLKPENLIVTRTPRGEEIRVLDFGIAKAVSSTREATSGLTGPGTTVGTLMYMSPEQADGARLDGRSDLYALGVILYELLSGARPIEADPGSEDSVRSFLTRLLLRPPTPLLERAPDVPPALAAVVMRCLAKEPGARPASARALRDELLKVQPLPTPAEPTTPRPAPDDEGAASDSIGAAKTVGGIAAAELTPPDDAAALADAQPTIPTPDPGLLRRDAAAAREAIQKATDRQPAVSGVAGSTAPPALTGQVTGALNQPPGDAPPGRASGFAEPPVLVDFGALETQQPFRSPLRGEPRSERLPPEPQPPFLRVAAGLILVLCAGAGLVVGLDLGGLRTRAARTLDRLMKGSAPAEPAPATEPPPATDPPPPPSTDGTTDGTTPGAGTSTPAPTESGPPDLKPLATIVLDGEGDLVAGPDGAVSVAGRVEGAPDGVDVTLAVQIDGVDVPSQAPVHAGTGGRFALTITFPRDGTYEIAVSPVAEGTLSIPTKRRVLVDARAPALTLDEPLEGASLGVAAGTARVRVRGKAEDPALASVTVNGQPASLADGAFDLTVPVDAATPRVEVVATDRGGHAERVTRTLARGGRLEVTVSTPLAGAVLAGGEVEVTGVVKGAALGERLDVRVAGVSARVGLDGAFFVPVHLTTGFVDLRIDARAGAATARLELPLVVLPPPGPTTPVSLQAGATPEEAALLTPGVQRRVDVGPDGWFAIDVPARHRLRVAAAFVHEKGDLDLHVYRLPDGADLAASVGSADHEEAAVVVRGDTRLLLQLHLVREGTQRAALAVDVAPAVLEDALEPNDTPIEAADLPLGTTAGLTAGTEDWYRVPVPAGRQLVATLDSTPAEGELGLLLVDADGWTVARSAPVEGGRPGQARLTAVVPRDGLLLRVTGAGGAYSLTAASQPGARLDRYEDADDSLETAPILPAGRHANLYCDRDELFRVTLPANITAKTLRATVTQPDEPGATPADRRVATIRTADGEALLAVADDAGTAAAGLRNGGQLCVQVTGGYGPYTLDLVLAPAEGRFEPNDVPEDAAPLQGGDWRDLGTRGHDWYALDLAVGQTVTISAVFQQALADLDLVLLGPGGDTVASSTGTTDAEELTWTATTAGRHLLHAYTAGSVPARYGLTVGLGPGGADLSHVRAGQRWTFGAGGTRQLVLTVVRVGAREVEYDEQPFEVVKGAARPAGVPERRTWRLDAVAALPGLAAARRQRLIVRTTTWECAVIQQDGGEDWIPLKDGRPTFPPVIRSTWASAPRDLLRVE